MTRAALRYVPLLLLGLAWEATARLGLVSSYALPPLSHVLVAFAGLADGDLSVQTIHSLRRAASGLGLAIVIGITVGVLMAWYRPVRMLASPIVQFFYPLPKSALIPLMIMWLGIGDAPTIALIFIGCMLPIVISSFNAVRGVDHLLIWSARSLGARERQLLLEIVIPASLPEILNGIRTALALAFILMISSELIIGQNGIGHLIGLLGENGDYSGMFAGVVLVSMLGFIADRLYGVATKRALRWVE